MPDTDTATAAAYKVLAQQAASIALADFAPKIGQIERAVARLGGVDPDEGSRSISPVSKWLGGIAATVVGAIIVAVMFWVASSVTEMQQTLARIDERQKAQAGQLDSRLADYDRRITQLEHPNSIGRNER